MDISLPNKLGLIFDLDGTLVNSMEDIANAINHTRAVFDHPPLPNPEITRYVGDGPAYLVKKTVPVPLDTLEKALDKYIEFYDDHLLENTALYSGVDSVLQWFHMRKLAVVTNKPQHQAEALLNGLGVAHHFHHVFGGDAFDRKKPDPYPLQVVMEKTSLTAEQFVMVGDGVHDIQAGKAAGITTVGISQGVASRGELQEAGADHIIAHMTELLDLIG